MNKRFLIPQNVDLARIALVSGNLAQLRIELNLLFPQRQGLIEQVLLALTSREHVLVWGTTGTAKSALATAIFDTFSDAVVFKTGLSKFSTSANIVGIPNPKRMREDGEIWHNTTGSIVPAHFAYLDEFLDASTPTLRVLLNILNERRFDQGAQHEVCQLLTAIATTNGNPATAQKASPELAAVIDRFIYRCQVQPLDEKAEQLAMITTYLEGAHHSVTIDIADFIYFTQLVTNYNLVSDPILVNAYIDTVNAYAKKAGVQVSDRTFAKLTQALEASALLHGRVETHPDDILAIKWGLCDGGDQAGHDLFTKVATPIIEGAKAQMGQTIDDVQLALIRELAKQVPSVPQSASKADLVDLAREITDMEARVDDIKPQLPTTDAEKLQLLTRLGEMKAKVTARIYKK